MVNCYEGLMAEGVIPIANEDDAVSLSMGTFTDNDELASLVAELLGADMLILLTDTDGLFNGHPDDADSELIPHLSSDDPEIGRAQVCTPVTNAQLVCCLLLEKKKMKHIEHTCEQTAQYG